MLMKCRLLILSSFFLGGCTGIATYQNETIINWDDFEEVVLSGKDIVFDEDIMKPYHLIVRDSILITANTNTSNICHLFNLNTYMKIGEKIAIGQGPNEMIHPFFINADDSLRLFDPMKSIIYIYSYDDFINSDNVSPSSQIQLNHIPYFGELSKLNDNLIGFSYEADAPCYVFDKTGKKLSKAFGDYPTGIMRQYSDLEIVNAYRSIVTTNGIDRVILGHMFTDLIDFYDGEGNLLKRLYGPDHFHTEFIEYKEGERIGSLPDGDYYRDAFYSPLCSDNKLYVLYNGKFVTEPNYNLLAEDILVFDLEGNPLYRYRLDKGVSRIAIDSINRKIYGISSNPDYHIVEFSY